MSLRVTSSALVRNGRAAMILSASASPIPGSRFRSALPALLRSTSFTATVLVCVFAGSATGSMVALALSCARPGIPDSARAKASAAVLTESMFMSSCSWRWHSQFATLTDGEKNPDASPHPGGDFNFCYRLLVDIGYVDDPAWTVAQGAGFGGPRRCQERAAEHADLAAVPADSLDSAHVRLGYGRVMA